MANVVYPKAKESFLKADLDLDSEVRVILVDLADYTYNAAHTTLADVPAGGRVAVMAAGVTTKTLTNGTLDHDDFVFSSVSGDACEALIWYQHNGAETGKLICFMDTGVTGLPVTPNGGNINVTINASGVFSL